MTISRRDLVTGGGLMVCFALGGHAFGKAGGEGQNGGQSGGEGQGGGPPPIAPGLPGSLAKFPSLDSWIRIAPDGRATIFTGKAELGQGIKTALLQLAADELDLPLARTSLVTADTQRTPDEGLTAGSHSMQDSGTAIRNAAANVRLLLVEVAARHWGVAPGEVATRDGTAIARDGRVLAFGVLVRGLSLTTDARPDVPLKPAAQHRLIGHKLPRVDIPAKLTGGAAYVHDLVLPAMLHARVVRGPSEGTRHVDPDWGLLERQPGVGRLVRNGRFAAIVGDREWPLVQALRVAGQMSWAPTHGALPVADLADALRHLPSRDQTILDRRDAPGARAMRRLEARYTRPYLLHGSIGPSCAVALFENGRMTVWTHSQGVFPLRKALAELLRMPAERVHCIHSEGAGCYGQNGADDVAADAALVALAMPGRPIRLLWSREQEHGWEPAGPAMVVTLAGGVDAAGRIAAWRYEVWSNTHNSRPAAAGDLLAGAELDPPFAATPPKPIPQPEGGGDRNAVPLYALPNATVISHFLPDMPIRVSALRSLGAHMNIFALESFVDELAAAAGRDPILFRLAHMEDSRARDVIMAAAAQFGWRGYRRRPGRAAGFGFARYKNLGAYCAVALDVEIEPDLGRLTVHRAVAAVDSGEAVAPDGIVNQIEGGIVQSLSWTGHEQMAFDARHRTSFDWSAYPILRFVDVPRRIDVHVIDRPGAPFLGTGEAAQGPTAAALANALAAACGQRIRDMPLLAGLARV